ncbi:hypothetical protein [Streptomyces sp. NPDC006551]|uniref:hypothetical protein n=1 Tax=Streptomyces sp. NPDC006551 TaxID=3157178 RepID=UPI0033A80ECD
MHDTLGPRLGVRVDGVEASAHCAADARGLLGMPLPDGPVLRAMWREPNRGPGL